MTIGNAPRREKVWFARCQHCRFSRKWGMWLQTTEAARRHSSRHVGHVVWVTIDRPDGEVFHSSYVENVETAHQMAFGEEPF